jgi:hypothetical protein
MLHIQSVNSHMLVSSSRCNMMFCLFFMLSALSRTKGKNASNSLDLKAKMHKTNPASYTTISTRAHLKGLKLKS